MRHFAFIYFFLFCCFAATEVCADIAVVVNPQNTIKNLNLQEVTALFMGLNPAFPNGKIALPFDLPAKCPTRNTFYKSIVGKNVNQVNAHWAKLIFSGQATPPRIALGEKEALKVVKNNRNAVAYMNAQDVTPDVKVVCLIKEKRNFDNWLPNSAADASQKLPRKKG